MTRYEKIEDQIGLIVNRLKSSSLDETTLRNNYLRELHEIKQLLQQGDLPSTTPLYRINHAITSIEEYVHAKAAGKSLKLKMIIDNVHKEIQHISKYLIMMIYFEESPSMY